MDDLQETGRVSMLRTMESNFAEDDDAIQALYQFHLLGVTPCSATRALT